MFDKVVGEVLAVGHRDLNSVVTDSALFVSHPSTKHSIGRISMTQLFKATSILRTWILVTSARHLRGLGCGIELRSEDI